MRVVGLSGVGFTFVDDIAFYFHQRGAYVISLNHILEQSCYDDEALKAHLLDFFGIHILDEEGEIDYSILEWSFYSNSECHAFYDRTVVPYLIEKSNRALDLLRTEGATTVVIVGVCLCNELETLYGCDELILTSAPLEIRYGRMKSSEGMSDDDFMRREGTSSCSTCGHRGQMVPVTILDASSNKASTLKSLENYLASSKTLLDTNDSEIRLGQLNTNPNPFQIELVPSEIYSSLHDIELNSDGILTRDPDYDDVDTFE